MARTTERDLEALVRYLNLLDPGKDYSMNFSGQGARLLRKGETVDVSPRLAKGELYRWMHAYAKGIETGRAAVIRENAFRFKQAVQ